MFHVKHKLNKLSGVDKQIKKSRKIRNSKEDYQKGYEKGYEFAFRKGFYEGFEYSGKLNNEGIKERIEKLEEIVEKQRLE